MTVERNADIVRRLNETKVEKFPDLQGTLLFSHCLASFLMCVSKILRVCVSHRFALALREVSDREELNHHSAEHKVTVRFFVFFRFLSLPYHHCYLALLGADVCVCLLSSGVLKSGHRSGLVYGLRACA